jgi:hypothetical protein
MIDIEEFKAWLVAGIIEHNEERKYFKYLSTPMSLDEKPTMSDLKNFIHEKRLSSLTGRYLVYEYEQHYPHGGATDLLIRTDDIENVKEVLLCLDQTYLPTYINYFDLVTNEIKDIRGTNDDKH